MQMFIFMLMYVGGVVLLRNFPFVGEVRLTVLTRFRERAIRSYRTIDNIADVLETYASFRELVLQAYRVYGSKDEHCITQKDTQPSQTCSGGFIKTQLRAIRCCFFAIGEYNLIKFNLFAQRHKYDHLDRPRGAGIRRLTGREEKQSSAN